MLGTQHEIELAHQIVGTSKAIAAYSKFGCVIFQHDFPDSPVIHVDAGGLAPQWWAMVHRLPALPRKGDWVQFEESGKDVIYEVAQVGFSGHRSGSADVWLRRKGFASPVIAEMLDGA